MRSAGAGAPLIWSGVSRVTTYNVLLARSDVEALVRFEQQGGSDMVFRLRR